MSTGEREPIKGITEVFVDQGGQAEEAETAKEPISKHPHIEPQPHNVDDPITAGFRFTIMGWAYECYMSKNRGRKMVRRLGKVVM